MARKAHRIEFISTSQEKRIEDMAPVQVICDLRKFKLASTEKREFDEIEFRKEFSALFQQASSAFVGQSLSQGASLAVKHPRGIFTLWVVDAAGQQRVEQGTEFNVVDVLREPIILYQCQSQKCGEYGPLRCETCMVENVPNGKERICSKHAYLIQDTNLAYCGKHRPVCQCSPNCTQTATFFCSGCYSKFERSKGMRPTKFYGEHVHFSHPHNKDVDYCDRCYDRLFRPCGICEKQGTKVSLGKLRCAFRIRNSKNECGEARCWDHSFQWKIWGPNFPGLVLCEQHKQYLENAHPADLLFTLLSARPPRATREARPYSLQNIYRVRRLINRNRQTPIAFEQLGQAFELLALPGVPWSTEAKKRYDELARFFQKFMEERPQAINDLLYKTRDFYQRIGKSALAQQIIWLDIEDQLRGGDKNAQYNIHIYLNSPHNVGLFIGKEGAFIKQLSAELNLNRVEFSCYQNGVVTSLKR
jgi:hypothetical protein